MIGAVVLLMLAAVAIEATPMNHVHSALWCDFKQTHGKTYTSVEEEAARFNIFIENQQKIDQHNDGFKAGNTTFQMAMNQFGDMTSQEFRSYVNCYKPTPPKSVKNVHQSSGSDLPDSVDWRTKGYVTDVKNQSNCGSCWAFSATGSLEGQHFKKTGKLVSLSEQELVDCCNDGCNGCNGGYVYAAFDYIKSISDFRGDDTEESYPYTAQVGECRAFGSGVVGVTVSGYTNIPSGDESALQSAISSVGPISVAIDASHDSFQFYSDGVYYEDQCSSTQLDHAVLVVGYGTSHDGQFYIVKNSWGTDWGMNGYIHMSRNRSNNCGIATNAIYPIVGRCATDNDCPSDSPFCCNLDPSSANCCPRDKFDSACTCW